MTRATRSHPEIRQGSSVRGAIDSVLVARQLAALRRQSLEGDEPTYQDVVYDAMVVALSGRAPPSPPAERYLPLDQVT